MMSGIELKLPFQLCNRFYLIRWYPRNGVIHKKIRSISSVPDRINSIEIFEKFLFILWTFCQNRRWGRRLSWYWLFLFWVLPMVRFFCRDADFAYICLVFSVSNVWLIVPVSADLTSLPRWVISCSGMCSFTFLCWLCNGADNRSELIGKFN